MRGTVKINGVMVMVVPKKIMCDFLIPWEISLMVVLPCHQQVCIFLPGPFGQCHPNTSNL